jgi:hypothetical protein
MPRVIRHEIAAADPGTISVFYHGLFGWDFQQAGDQDYWVIDGGEGAGIDGAMVRRYEGGPGTINTIAVPSVDDAIAKVAQLGGAVAMPKATLPGTGYLAYCMDPEGNVFGVLQLDEKAK